MRSKTSEQALIVGHFTVQCTDKTGQLKWEDGFNNVVTLQGRDHLLNHGLSGSAVAVNTRMSLIASGTPTANDTHAAHPGFVEVPSTVVASRGAVSWAASSGGSKGTATPVSFNAIGAGTISGCAINLIVGAVGNLGVVGDTSTSGAVLYSAGLFSLARAVIDGDILNVTYTTTLS